MNLKGAARVWLFWCVVGLHVDASHERQPPPCSPGCSCDSGEDSANERSSVQAQATIASFTINCTAGDLKDVPVGLPDSPAERLILSRNKISHLDLSFLRGFPNLKMFLASDNGLKAVSKSGDNYVPFYSLQSMDLSNNHLHVVHSYVFTGFPSLKTLNLSGNAIHTISETALNLPALETLDLSHNQLSVVQSHFFESSPKLLDIDLSHNSLSRLNDATFGFISHLSLLDLSHNSLMKLEDNVLLGMNITHLDLGYNSFRKSPGLALRKLIAAKTIVLDGNLFTVLDNGALEMIRVEFLSISNSQNLFRLGKKAIVSLPNLEALTMNNNRHLSYVHPQSVSGTPRLAALDLSYNSLYSMEEGLEKAVPSLKAIYLKGNPLKCHCGIRWMQTEGRTLKVADIEQVTCQSHDTEEPVLLTQIRGKFQHECEPYILPLFEPTQEEMMGKNMSWFCQALGSDDIELSWKLPHRNEIVRSNDCSERMCFDKNLFTIRYLHPFDSGRYTCLAKNKYGQDQRQIVLRVKSEHIQIFPITIASTFVTLSWNTSGSLSTGRGYILRVRSAPRPKASAEKKVDHLDASEEEEEEKQKEEDMDQIVRQYEDIDVGLKMNSYTVNGLSPGMTYLFELCLRKEIYVITISTATLTTKNSGYEVALGIETDYVTLFSVALILAGIVIACVAFSGLRWWKYRMHLVRMRSKDSSGDNLSQREMIMSPSDHSSVNFSHPGSAKPCSSSMSSSAANAPTIQPQQPPPMSFKSSILSTCEKSILMENEVSTPTDDLDETVT